MVSPREEQPIASSSRIAVVGIPGMVKVVVGQCLACGRMGRFAFPMVGLIPTNM